MSQAVEISRSSEKAISAKDILHNSQVVKFRAQKVSEQMRKKIEYPQILSNISEVQKFAYKALEEVTASVDGFTLTVGICDMWGNKLSEEVTNTRRQLLIGLGYNTTPVLKYWSIAEFRAYDAFEPQSMTLSEMKMIVQYLFEQFSEMDAEKLAESLSEPEAREVSPRIIPVDFSRRSLQKAA